jgi:hypothetical protein
MDTQELLAINSEFAEIVAEARNTVQTATPPNTVGRVAMLFEPTVLYGRAAAKLHGIGGPDSDSVTVGDFERAIRMTAAKIRAGDRAYIIESLVGQAVWLQALALRLSDYAATFHDVRQKVPLGNLIMKIQTTTAKCLATLAGVACLDKR